MSSASPKQSTKHILELEELEYLMREEFFPLVLTSKETHVLASRLTNYQYSPIPATNTIRVLKLHPGISSQTLIGSLINLPLSDPNHRPYESLSYAWGTSTAPHFIYINQLHVRITPSLNSALLRIRSPTKKRYIWIDAICINQSDNAEKSEQIVLMPEIYSNASSVIVYLGEDTKDGEVSLALLERIGKAGFGKLKELKVTNEWMVEERLPGRGSLEWLTLLVFFTRSWFRRAWVAQEFILGKHVNFICGTSEVNWRSLSLGVQNLVEYNLIDWGMTSEQQSFFPEDIKQIAFEARMCLRLMMDMKSSNSLSSAISYEIRSFASRDESSLPELYNRDILKGYGIEEAVATLRQQPDLAPEVLENLDGTMEATMQLLGIEDKGFKLALIQLLNTFEYLQSTIPRDRLFALSGLSNDGNHEDLRPDYNKTDEAVLLQFARYFVKTGNGPFMLSRAGLAAREPDSKLPSWVTNYTAGRITSLQPLCVVSDCKLAYFAGTKVPPNFSLAPDHPSELLISGSYLGMIKRIIHYPAVLSTSTESCAQHATEIKAYLETAESLILSPATPYPSPTNPLQPATSRFQILWRTLIGNTSQRPEAPPEEWGEYYEPSKKAVDVCIQKDTYFDPLEMTPWFSVLLQLSGSYSLVELEEGWVGLAPKIARDGDRVVVVGGMGMPVVLRKAESEEGIWRLVGNAYVYGVMNGEAVDLPEWKEEIFRLR